jgi:hypothetical protein
MTLREVVTARNAKLAITGVSADDPDFRVALWSAVCTWCPNDDEPRGRPFFEALAITTDGFATTTYRRLPFQNLGLWRVESPGPGLLLIVDAGFSGKEEWLVRDDGTLTPVARVVEDRPAAGPRLWHRCQTVDEGSYDITWCALDPRTNTDYVWDDPWRNPAPDSSAVNPGSGSEPWGYVDPPDDHLIAYWYDGGVRRTRDFGFVRAKGVVNHLPRGEMAVWGLDAQSHVLTIHASSDGGATWQTSQLQAPSYSYYLVLSATPGGGVLAREDDAYLGDSAQHPGEGIRIWRADSLDAERFDVVYAARTRTDGLGWYLPPFDSVDGRIWTGGLFSDDDGRTWSEVPRWR